MSLNPVDLRLLYDRLFIIIQLIFDKHSFNQLLSVAHYYEIPYRCGPRSDPRRASPGRKDQDIKPDTNISIISHYFKF